MNKALGILLIVLIAMGCQTSAFDPPEFGPFFNADVVFSNGTSFNASAGVDDYYMFTKGYKANDLKLYSSTLSPDQNCTGNCNEQLTLNIYQGEPNGTINSLDQLDFYSTNDQNVIHTLEASKDDNEVYNSVWRVNKDQESTLSQIEFNQEYGETDDINVNLVYSNEHKSFVRFGQTFSPLAEEDFSISVDLTREPNGTILAKVVDDGNIEFIKWNDNQSNFIRVFTGGSLNASFNVISKTGQHVNCTIKIWR